MVALLVGKKVVHLVEHWVEQMVAWSEVQWAVLMVVKKVALLDGLTVDLKAALLADLTVEQTVAGMVDL